MVNRTPKLLFSLLSVASICGCAGYQFGQQSLYRADVRTVHVPVFESDSFRRNLGERLTEAVVKQIELKTPYRVVSRDRADSQLVGRIISESKQVVSEDRFDVPRVIQSDLVAQVQWRGPQGDLLTNSISIPVDQYQLRVGQQDQFIPESGQSLATSHQHAIENLAEQIVAQMELAPW